MGTEVCLPPARVTEVSPFALGRRLSSGRRFRGFPTEIVSPPPQQEIPASPFRVKVDPSHDASKVKAEGPGLSKAGKRACVKGHPGGLLRASDHGHVWSGDLEGLISTQGRCSFGAPIQQGQCCCPSCWQCSRAPAPVADCLPGAGADEPVRLVVRVKPLQPGLSPHFTICPSRRGKRETNPLHGLHQRGRKSPAERAVQRPPPWRCREGLGHH